MGLFSILTGKNAKLLKLQKLLVKKSPNRLIMSEKQLMDTARRTAKRYLEICNDSMRLVDTTIKPDVFFSRLDLLLNNLSELQELEKYISFSSSPSKSLARIRFAKQDVIHDFLVRYHKSIVAQANAAKTPRGKEGKYKKFEESLRPYYTKMNAQNILFVKSHSSMQ